MRRDRERCDSLPAALVDKSLDRRPRNAGYPFAVRVLSIYLITIFACSSAYARALPVDRALELITDEYLKIQEALSLDSRGAEGSIAKAAKRIQRVIAQVRRPEATANKDTRQNAETRWMVDTISEAARTLLTAKKLGQLRLAFSRMSRPLAVWAQRYQPKGISVVHSVQAGAVWLQRGKTLRNPYLGAEYTDNGRIVDGANKGIERGRMSTCRHGSARNNHFPIKARITHDDHAH